MQDCPVKSTYVPEMARNVLEKQIGVPNFDIQVWSHVYTVIQPLKDIKEILWRRIWSLREKSQATVQVVPRLEAIPYMYVWK